MPADVQFWHPPKPYQYRFWRESMLIYCETFTIADSRWLKNAVGLAAYNHWDVVTVGHPGKWTGATGIVRREAAWLGVRVILCETPRAARNTASRVAQRNKSLDRVH